MSQDQLEPLIDTDLLNSEHLRQLVSEKLRTLKPSEEPKIKNDTFISQFANAVQIVGLSDLIKAKYKLIKILWLIVFLGGLFMTGFLVYKEFDEFEQHPTASKLSIFKPDFYHFPRIALCLDAWINTRKSMAMGLSKEAIQYALRYLIPLEDVATQNLDPSKKIPSAKEKFMRIYRAYNFTNLIDFFKYISLEAVWNSHNILEIKFRCTGCIYRERLEKVVINKAMCYILPLDLVEGKLRQSYGLPEFEFRIPDLSQDIQERKEYWKLYINPSMVHLTSDSPYSSVYDQRTHSVSLYSVSYNSQIGVQENCIDKTGYSSAQCVEDCAFDYYHALHGCRVLNLDGNYSRKLDEYCNTYDWDRWPVQDINMESDVPANSMEKCVKNCKPECAITTYFMDIESRSSNFGVENKRLDASKYRYAKIYFINLNVMKGGIRTLTEVSTYSFQTLISNIGGTCGIWIGASVMTLVQVCMFFVERSIDKGQCNGSKKRHQTREERIRKYLGRNGIANYDVSI